MTILRILGDNVDYLRQYPFFFRYKPTPSERLNLLIMLVEVSEKLD